MSSTAVDRCDGCCPRCRTRIEEQRGTLQRYSDALRSKSDRAGRAALEHRVIRLEAALVVHQQAAERAQARTGRLVGILHGRHRARSRLAGGRRVSRASP